MKLWHVVVVLVVALVAIWISNNVSAVGNLVK